MPNEDFPSFLTDKRVRASAHFGFYVAFASILVKVLHLLVVGFRWGAWYTLPLDLWVMTGMGVSVWRYQHRHYTLDDQVPLCQDRFDNYKKLGLRYFFIYRGHDVTVYPNKVTCPVCKSHEKLPKAAPTRFGLIS